MKFDSFMFLVFVFFVVPFFFLTKNAFFDHKYIYLKINTMTEAYARYLYYVWMKRNTSQLNCIWFLCLESETCKYATFYVVCTEKKSRYHRRRHHIRILMSTARHLCVKVHIIWLRVCEWCFFLASHNLLPK